MTATPETLAVIAKLLPFIDVKVDANWTDDGAPLVGVVQKLANDKTITREDINLALPGFVRKVVDATKTSENMTVTDTPPEGAEAVAKAAAFDPSMEPEIDGPGEELSEDEVRAILNRRIRDAETNLSNARKVQAEANAEVIRCDKRLARAHEDHNRQFPPITAADNIKQHLASQARLIQERAGLLDENGNIVVRDKRGAVVVTNPMQRSPNPNRGNSRGWTRPPVAGIGGIRYGNAT